jgi:hypothetical protein
MKRHAQEDFAERVRVNQQKLSSGLRTRFDYIVCGAGTSGCVVAARLTSALPTRSFFRVSPPATRWRPALSSASGRQTCCGGRTKDEQQQ